VPAGVFCLEGLRSVIYSLLVLSAPVSGHGARAAVEFAQCAIARGHTIHRIFFLDAGTVTGSGNSVLPQDEQDPALAWAELHTQHAVELIICISSALKYGMLDETEAARYERPQATIHPAFKVSGLGQLVDACAHADRLITFGG
jgi:tRNA 2-thiouridine synthesizing protein D